MILFITLFLIFLYFLPTLIAVWRKKRSLLAIFICNCFFGLTIVGWGISLIWAVARD